MKYARFLDGTQGKWGVVEGDAIVELDGAPWTQHRFHRGRSRPLSSVKLLAPIEPHNKVVALGAGYAPKGERDGPGIFVKPPNTITNPLDQIVVPKVAERVIFEAELAIVVGEKAKSVSRAEALGHIFGYTVVNDVTATGLKTKDGPPTIRFKAFDTFCPTGPLIATDVDGNNARIRSRVNGVAKQDASTSRLTWSIEEIVAWVSGIMTLLPGDIISTSTPPGLDVIRPGDVVECEIEGIGVLRNPVVLER